MLHEQSPCLGIALLRPRAVLDQCTSQADNAMVTALVEATDAHAQCDSCRTSSCIRGHWCSQSALMPPQT
eukprot:12194828-Alexandrium_andersonii.AAC.1